MTHRSKWIACAAVLMSLFLVACGGPSTEPGNAERGKALFDAPVESPRGELQPCSDCHAVVEGQKSRTGLGTNFHDLGARAGSMVQGQTAEQYLRTSIVDPDAYLAGNFQDGLMSRDYSKLLAAAADRGSHCLHAHTKVRFLEIIPITFWEDAIC